MRLRVVSHDEWRGSVDRMMARYRVYYRHLRVARREVGPTLAAYLDRYWGPWLKAFERRERLIRQQSARPPQRAS